MAQLNACSVCKGVGGCPSCRGAGTSNGKRCLICRGSGTCPVCGQAFDPNATPPAPIQEPVQIVRPIVPATVHLVSSIDVPVTVTRWSNAKLTTRAVLALLFLVAFYVFALGVVALLLLITWVQVQLFTQARSGGVLILAQLIIPPLGALAILLAIRPRFPNLGYPGRGLNPQLAPELLDVLRDVARLTRQKMPRAVYLFDGPNAAVFDRGTFLGRGLLLGLPFFDALTIGELRAIVAHEFGHYANRAGPITTTVYRATRTFAAATAAAGAVPFLDGVFEVWSELFLRLAMPISRQYELRCDELACRVAGIETTVSALTKISNIGEFSEIANPVAGWEEDLHSTHPPLRDRVASARALDLRPPSTPSDDRPASVLLERLLRPVAPA